MRKNKFPEMILINENYISSLIHIKFVTGQYSMHGVSRVNKMLAIFISYYFFSRGVRLTFVKDQF